MSLSVHVGFVCLCHRHNEVYVLPSQFSSLPIEHGESTRVLHPDTRQAYGANPDRVKVNPNGFQTDPATLIVQIKGFDGTKWLSQGRRGGEKTRNKEQCHAEVARRLGTGQSVRMGRRL